MGKTKKFWGILLLLICLIGVFVITKNMTSDNSIQNLTSQKPNEPDSLLTNFLFYEKAPSNNYKYYDKNTKVKGVYVNPSAAGSKKRMDYLVNLADNTEVNAFVVDVKADEGTVTFDMNLEAVKKIKANSYTTIRDINAFMDKIYKHNIYPIARIVCFKDPYLAENVKEYAIKNKDGSLWYYKKIAWINPYNRDSWEYIVNIAKEAAKVGFKEIQFDYIRFEATSTLKDVDFGFDSNELARTQVIYNFIDYAKKELEPYNIKLAADVFGIIIMSEKDAHKIGQDYIEMTKRLDVICPMVYPSHYGFGFYGTPTNQHSDLFPYKIIRGSMDDSTKVLAAIDKNTSKAIVRPWLQAFTASYLGKPNYKSYGGEELRQQIQATYDAGLEEWILWHAGSNYDSVMSGFEKE